MACASVGLHAGFANDLCFLTGQLNASMQDKSDIPWHEDPQFWVGLREGIFDQQLWENADTEVTQLLTMVGLPAAAAVLDIPCGPGRHLVPLARRGLQLCGVDLSHAYLAEAGQRAAAAGVSVELVQGDMRRFVRPASFDLAICMYTSFGYFSEPQDDVTMLQNLYRSLRPAGHLVLELVTKETAVATGPHAYEVGSGRRIVEHAQLLEGGTIIQRRWQLQGPELDRSWIAWHRLYSVDELCSLLRQAGFARTTVYGALDGRPFSPSGEGATVVAER
jgi:SAM-dependent methyltransferase